MKFKIDSKSPLDNIPDEVNFDSLKDFVKWIVLKSNKLGRFEIVLPNSDAVDSSYVNYTELYVLYFHNEYD